MNAVKQLHDNSFGGHKLIVDPYREPNRVARNNTAAVQKTNLFVSGLPNGINEVQVRDIFAEFGTIRSILLKSPVPQNDMTKHITSLLPIYSMAYVNFETEEAASAAFELNTRNPMSQIRVAFYERNERGPATFSTTDSGVRGNTNYCILFITKLNKQVSNEQLKEICSKYGTVQQCKLSMGFNKANKHVSLGKATVSFASSDEASEAMKKLYFESALGDYVQVDFYKSREGRLDQVATNS